MRNAALSRLLAGSIAIISAATAIAHAEDFKPPEPVALWPSGPLNLVVAFSRPVEPEWARTLVGTSISMLDPTSNRAGDQTSGKALGKLHIAGVTRLDGGRTLMLATDPHAAVVSYAISPGSGESSNRSWTYDLSGVEVSWSTSKEDEGQGPDWKGWWPDLDLEACRQLFTGSASHERGFGLLDHPGHLALNTLLSLPAGEAVVRIETGGTVSDATLGDEPPAAQASDSKIQFVEFPVTSRGDPLFLTLTITTGEKQRPPFLRALWAAGRSRTLSKIPRERFLLPWAPVALAAAPADVDSLPDLKGGDPKRGETLFFSEQTRCSQCHRVGDRGGMIGPDLTNVAAKGQAHIYRSIAAPSAEISPEYRPFTVALRDGRVFAGIVRAQHSDEITVADTGAKTTTLQRDAVEQIRPSATSIMPVGLAGVLGKTGLRDLIAYLTSKGVASGKVTRPD
jgi:putative heme-binding domain-containing protein